VVLFGVFLVKEITMPARAEDIVECLLVANPYHYERETDDELTVQPGRDRKSPLPFFDVTNLLQHTEPPVLPSMTQFFDYALRK
jgi:hypothetical protein